MKSKLTQKVKINIDENNLNFRSELRVSEAVHLSEDAGHYLCDFIYYKSLHMMSGNAVFVHVPELDEEITAEKISFDLAQIIRQISKH